MSRTRREDLVARIGIAQAALLALVLSMFASVAGGGTILHVDDDAPPGGNGQSWDTAFRYLQDALASAQPGSGVDEIRVGQGTYRPDQDEGGNVTPGDREASFVLIDGVALRGGYAGLGTPDPDEREIDLYQSVLSGDLLGDDGPGFANRADNTYQISNGSGTDATAVLDGFTITAGYAVGDFPLNNGAGIYNEEGSPTVESCVFVDNWADHWGGGMCNHVHSSPTVTDCRFINNVARTGGGMCNYYYDCNPVIAGCVFTGNSSIRSGGAISSMTVCSPTLTDCVIEDNSAAVNGGALFLDTHSDPVLENCIIAGNSAGEYGGGVYGCDDCNPVFTGCTFSENSAFLQGGAVVLWKDCWPLFVDCQFLDNVAETGYGGGAISNDNGGLTTLIGCHFASNSANAGGAVYNVVSSHVSCTDCSFVENHSGRGGALFSGWGSSAVLLNCALYRNSTAYKGGAVYQGGGAATLINCNLCDNTTLNEGGGICIENCDAVIRNCTFAGNEAEYGGAIFNEERDPSLANCILWSNQATYGNEVYAESGAVAFCYSDIQGCGGSGQGWDAGLGHDGGGNIDADPLFVDPGMLDYHVSAGSPCIDAGINSVLPRDIGDFDEDGLDCERFPMDLDGNGRFNDDPAAEDTGCGLPVIVDMGAYEFAGTEMEVVYGDVDANAVVDIDDVFDILWGWGPGEGCSLADVDGDFTADIDDIFAVLANWGPCE